MSIKITVYSGTDWADGNVLYSADLIQTIKAAMVSVPPTSLVALAGTTDYYASISKDSTIPMANITGIYTSDVSGNVYLGTTNALRGVTFTATGAGFTPLTNAAKITDDTLDATGGTSAVNGVATTDDVDYIQGDMGADKTGYLYVYNIEGTQSVGKNVTFKIKHSTDGTNWTTLETVTGTGAQLLSSKLYTSQITARYIRITFYSTDLTGAEKIYMTKSGEIAFLTELTTAALTTGTPLMLTIDPTVKIIKSIYSIGKISAGSGTLYGSLSMRL